MQIIIWIWIILFIIRGFSDLIVTFIEEKISNRIAHFLQMVFDIGTIYLLYTALIK